VTSEIRFELYDQFKNKGYWKKIPLDATLGGKFRILVDEKVVYTHRPPRGGSHLPSRAREEYTEERAKQVRDFKDKFQEALKGGLP
jgi:hypothetical protein